MDQNNNDFIVLNHNRNSTYNLANFDQLTAENVEAELQKMHLIDDNYDSDEDDRDRVKLTGKGIDFRALKAGQDIEFEYDPDKEEDNFNWDDENDKIDYTKIYNLKNPELVSVNGANEVGEEKEEDDEDNSQMTPFEKLRSRMVDISPSKDNGVLKRILIPGSGLIIPNGSRVRIHYNAYFEMNDEPFDSTHLRNKSFEFKLGAKQVVWGLDIAVATMKRFEKAQFIFEPDYFCGKFGCEPRVPRETAVLFEIEVISYVEANEYDTYEASSEEQREKISMDQMLKICNCLRELGNDNYIRMNYKESSKKYRKAIYLMDKISVKNDQEEEKWKSVMLKLYLNMSQVCLKQVKPKKTIFYCKLALDLEPQNAKATYRYGKSLRLLQDFDRSRKFLLKAYNLAPTNKDIFEEMKKLDEDIAKYKFIEKDFYKKMFKMDKKGEENCKDDLTIDNKKSLPDNKDEIIRKLNEFASNEKAKVFKIQLDMHSLDDINFIIREAESLNLTIRSIKGETNIMQIMKQ